MSKRDVLFANRQVVTASAEVVVVERSDYEAAFDALPIAFFPPLLCAFRIHPYDSLFDRLVRKHPLDPLLQFCGFHEYKFVCDLDRI